MPRLSPTDAANVRVRSRSLLVSCRSLPPSSMEEREGKRRGRATDPSSIAAQEATDIITRRRSTKSRYCGGPSCARSPHSISITATAESQHLCACAGAARGGKRENGCMMPPRFRPPECPTSDWEGKRGPAQFQSGGGPRRKEIDTLRRNERSRCPLPLPLSVSLPGNETKVL